jgi:chorismate dehydratase
MYNGHNIYTLVETADGSRSLYAAGFEELMHTDEGAYSEALIKHIYPSGLLKNSNQTIHILDIGFGMGYNILAALYEILRKTDRHVSIVSLEKSNETYPYLKGISFGDDRDIYYKTVLAAFKTGSFLAKNFQIRLYFGDARHNVQKLYHDQVRFDYIFHDPFSPGKNSELWTLDFFALLSEIIEPHGVLTTYSSARQIRSAMHYAGFRVGKGPAMGRKKEGTIATPAGDIQELTKEELHELLHSIKATPYRDEHLDARREDISERRRSEMKRKRMQQG